MSLAESIKKETTPTESTPKLHLANSEDQNLEQLNAIYEDVYWDFKWSQEPFKSYNVTITLLSTESRSKATLTIIRGIYEDPELFVSFEWDESPSAESLDEFDCSSLNLDEIAESIDMHGYIIQEGWKICDE